MSRLPGTFPGSPHVLPLRRGSRAADVARGQSLAFASGGAASAPRARISTGAKAGAGGAKGASNTGRRVPAGHERLARSRSVLRLNTPSLVGNPKSACRGAPPLPPRAWRAGHVNYRVAPFVRVPEPLSPRTLEFLPPLEGKDASAPWWWRKR